MDREALRMVCSREFWRMAVLWTVSLLYSYILLFFLRRGAPVPRLRPMPEPDDDAARRRRRRPVCVITGVTDGSRLRSFLLACLQMESPLSLFRVSPSCDVLSSWWVGCVCVCMRVQATSGLGKAAAAALAREGYHVILGGSPVSFSVLVWAFHRTPCVHLWLLTRALPTVQIMGLL